MFPIYAEATNLPFAHDYFDALVCIDAYHYFGRKKSYFTKKLLPHVRAGGFIYIAIPRLKEELLELPDEMSGTWTLEDLQTWHSVDWWKEQFDFDVVECHFFRELNCFEQSWEDWLATDSEYAKNDARAMSSGAGKYMKIIWIILQEM